MAKYHFTNKAVEDLTNIWNYTFETWSERQADMYYNMLIESCQKIVENPWLYGFKYDEITEGLRGYRANKHIIFYQILQDDEILIIRILHQRMDLKRRMNED
jgi:toxin ParE1/3/4